MKASMRLRYMVQLCMFLLAMTAIPALASAGPIDRVKMSVDKVIGILTDPALKRPGKEGERKVLVRKAIDELFDWESFSRRALATHWNKRTPEEKKQFIELFGKLLERTYMDRVQNYSGEKVKYLGEKIEGEYGEVKTMVVSKGEQDISVNYRLMNKGGDWFVYDVYIEGVSLVNNYRVQFNEILLKSPYQELVKRLEEKIAEKPEKK